MCYFTNKPANRDREVNKSSCAKIVAILCEKVLGSHFGQKNW